MTVNQSQTNQNSPAAFEESKAASILEEMRLAGHLPAINDNVQAVCSITSKAGASASELVSIIMRDCGLVSSIIAAANSTAYSPKYPIKTISAAVTFLGFEKVRALALGLAIFKQTMQSVKNQKLAYLYASSYFAGTFAMNLARDARYHNPEETFVAGLLYRLPWVALANTYPDKFIQMEKLAVDSKISYELACEKIFSIKYPSICKGLARMYNLPEKIAEVLNTEPGIAVDPVVNIVHESAHISNMIFGNRQGGQEALVASSERLKKLMRVPNFSVPDFIKNVCKEDDNIQRFFKIDKSDVDMMVNALEWGKGNPAQIASHFIYDEDPYKNERSNESPETLIGSFLTELMLNVRRGIDINNSLLIAQEALFRCVPDSEVFIAFLNRNRTQLVGRFYAGTSTKLTNQDFNIALSLRESPVIKALEVRGLSEWEQKGEDSLHLPFIKRYVTLRRAAMVPLAARGVVIGLVFVGRSEFMLFNDREKIWIEQIASLLGNCFENTQASLASVEGA